MGKTSKGLSDTEKEQQEEIKNLKSQIKHLEREIKKQGNKPESYGSKKRQDTLIQEEYDQHNLCQQCFKGHITTVELGPRSIKTCTVGCGYKEIIKK